MKVPWRFVVVVAEFFRIFPLSLPHGRLEKLKKNNIQFWKFNQNLQKLSIFVHKRKKIVEKFCIKKEKKNSSKRIEISIVALFFFIHYFASSSLSLSLGIILL